MAVRKNNFWLKIEFLARQSHFLTQGYILAKNIIFGSNIEYLAQNVITPKYNFWIENQISGSKLSDLKIQCLARKFYLTLVKAGFIYHIFSKATFNFLMYPKCVTVSSIKSMIFQYRWRNYFDLLISIYIFSTQQLGLFLLRYKRLKWFISKIFASVSSKIGPY